MAPKAILQSIKHVNVHRKIAIAFLLMSLVPILLVLQFVQTQLLETMPESVISQLRWLIFLMVCIAIGGYWIVRNIALGLTAFAKSAKEVVERGVLNKDMLVTDEEDEIGELARTFNKITKDLEQKIISLEQTKALIQDLFQKVGKAITSTENIDHLLVLVVESMLDVLEARSGILMLVEVPGDQLKSKLVCGEHQTELSQLVMKKGEGAFGWVVEQARPLAVTSSTAEFQLEKAKIGVSYQSLLSVPLLYQGKVLGVIAVIDKKNGAGFTKDEQIVLENVASQIAVAIENARLNTDAERTYFETISALAIAVEAKDSYTRGHLKRVSEYVEELAKEMGFDEKAIRVMKDGAFLHDLGKIAINDEILRKPGQLTPQERVAMKEHAVIGENIIAPLSSLRELRAIVRYHQEWYDGTGYPDGLKGEEIPIGARILAVVDVYDALTTDRPYRRALPHEVALKMICDESGTHFDPQVVSAFIRVAERISKPASKPTI